MSWYTAGEIVLWLVIAAVLGGILGWLLRGLLRSAARPRPTPVVVEDEVPPRGTRVSDIRVTYPRQHPVVPVGTVYPLGAEEVGSPGPPTSP